MLQSAKGGSIEEMAAQELRVFNSIWIWKTWMW